jgi:hypothetical protein
VRFRTYLLIFLVASVISGGTIWFSLSASARPPVAQVQIPVITSATVGCSTNREHVVIRMITPWEQNHSTHIVHVEGWFDGGWRPMETLLTVPDGLVVKGGYGRLRAYIESGYRGTPYKIVGPEAGPFGSDLCSPAVDSYVTP